MCILYAAREGAKNEQDWTFVLCVYASIVWNDLIGISLCKGRIKWLLLQHSFCVATESPSDKLKSIDITNAICNQYKQQRAFDSLGVFIDYIETEDI